MPISQAGLFGDTVGYFTQEFSAVKKQSITMGEVIQWRAQKSALPSRPIHIPPLPRVLTCGNKTCSASAAHSTDHAATPSSSQTGDALSLKALLILARGPQSIPGGN